MPLHVVIQEEEASAMDTDQSEAEVVVVAEAAIIQPEHNREALSGSLTAAQEKPETLLDRMLITLSKVDRHYSTNLQKSIRLETMQ